MKVPLLLITPLLLIPFFGTAQRPLYRAPVGTVDSSGFYRIPLRPFHTKYMRSDFGDLRLYGEKKGETPFLIREVEKKERSTEFRELEPLKSEQKGGYTGIIFERPRDSSIKRLVLYVEKPSRSMRIRVEGSQKPRGGWKEVNAEERVRSSIGDTASSEYWVDEFLGSGHRYYRIRIGAPAPPPPELVTMGYRVKPESPDPLHELPAPKLRQKDLNEKSYVRITLDTLRRIDQLEVHLDGPRFFRRNVTVALPKREENEVPVPYTPIGGGVLSDTLERIGGLDPRKSVELLLVVQNGDDPPLDLEQVRLFQDRRYLVAHLEKGEKYHLRSGGEKKELPNYDLQQFQDRIPDELPVKEAAPPQAVGDAMKGKEERSTLWIWLSILLSILVLGAFSYRLVKEGKD